MAPAGVAMADLAPDIIRRDSVPSATCAGWPIPIAPLQTRNYLTTQPDTNYVSHVFMNVSSLFLDIGPEEAATAAEAAVAVVAALVPPRRVLYAAKNGLTVLTMQQAERIKFALRNQRPVREAAAQPGPATINVHETRRQSPRAVLCRHCHGRCGPAQLSLAWAAQHTCMRTVQGMWQGPPTLMSSRRRSRPTPMPTPMPSHGSIADSCTWKSGPIPC